ncbi:MAG: DUF2760 domain-containing protein [Aquabacterium sp.]|jgi:hypothetical protein|uniref:DUF2760 domain-containing protein n=1 Tax=Aquabacterium sp. TaxID=1872578 RepID=UPI002A3652DA|nr:DUF2760 domain-containing protein [Aquabacterium sp.]MDX9844565.1 DUF2760 domain-containing protein [Aquabacterium sp.]
MSSTPPSLSRRISLAFGSFFGILSRPDFAANVERLRSGDVSEAYAALPPSSATTTTPMAEPAAVTPAPLAASPVAAPTAPVVPATPKAADTTAALQLLSLLQREARLVDFVQEDIAAYSDAEIGAAARVVHEGCRKVLREHVSLAPVRAENEGSRLTLPAGFDASAVRLTGNVVGQAPFTGTLTHRGWRATEVRLPQLTEGHDAQIVAQAEVEL